MFNIENLSSFYRDVLKEIGNIGAGNAATALSQFLAEKIEMTVPEVSILPLEKIGDLMGGPEELVVGIYMRVFGDAPGKLIFVFQYADALILVDKLIGSKIGVTQTLGDFEESALKEISNIMTGAYLYALIQLTGFTLLPSVPAFACDMAGAILNSALLEFGVRGDHALLVETQFQISQRKINGNFFLVPDPGALENIMNALGVGPSCQK